MSFITLEEPKKQNKTKQKNKKKQVVPSDGNSFLRPIAPKCEERNKAIKDTCITWLPSFISFPVCPSPKLESLIAPVTINFIKYDGDDPWNAGYLHELNIVQTQISSSTCLS